MRKVNRLGCLRVYHGGARANHNEHFKEGLDVEKLREMKEVLHKKRVGEKEGHRVARHYNNKVKTESESCAPARLAPKRRLVAVI